MGCGGGWSVLVAKFAATDLILKKKKRFVNKPFRNKIMRPVPVSLWDAGHGAYCDVLGQGIPLSYPGHS